MMTLKITEQLKELGLLDEFENKELTIARLSYFLNIPFSKVEKALYKKGFPKAITYTTLVDQEWLPVIFTFKPTRRKIFKIKKTQVKREVNIGPKPKNKTLIRNWMKRKQTLKDSERKFIKPTFINTPMGGKVKK
jgi:hypothetical protein